MTRHRGYRWLTLLVLITLTLAAAACGGGDDKKASTPGAGAATPAAAGATQAAGAATQAPRFTGSVNVGMSTTLSGSSAGLGKSGLQGAQLAVDDLNAKGGLLQKEIKLVSADDAANAQTGTQNVRTMILDQKVVAMIGPVTSAVAAATQPIAAQNKVPIFFHTSNDIVLTTKQYSKYTFQLVPNTVMEPRAVAEYLSKQPYRRYYTISPDYNYGRDTVDAFLKAMKEFGIDVEVVGQQWPKLGATDFTAVISAALAAKPDFVFLGVFGGDLLTFTKQAKGFNFFAQVKAGGPFGLDLLPVLKTDVPAGAVAWSRGPFFAIDTPATKDFTKRYKEKHGEWPTEWSLLAYTAVQTWAEGVTKANAFDGEKVADALGGATVTTIRGPIKLRACDHQAEIPEFVGLVSAKEDATYGFPLLENVFVADPQKIMLTCDQAKELQPK